MKLQVQQAKPKEVHDEQTLKMGWISREKPEAFVFIINLNFVGIIILFVLR